MAKAGDRLKESLRLQGKTYFDYEDNTYFFSKLTHEIFPKVLHIIAENLGKEDQEVLEDGRLRDLISDATGYTCMREDSGNRHWIFFNPKDYQIKYYMHRYLGAKNFKVKELPLNCSSCREMFSELRTEEDVYFDLDLTGVVDATEIFSKCFFGGNFEIGQNFKMGDLKEMACAFKRCTFGKEVRFEGMDFNPVENARSMFEEAVFSRFLKLPNSFVFQDSANCKYMFECCEFWDGLELNQNFECPKEMKDMFFASKIPCVDTCGQSTEDIVKELKG